MKMSKIVSVCLASALALTTIVLSPAPKAHATAVNGDTVGFSHIASKYNFAPTEDFLNEGADTILELGSRVIKVSMFVGRQDSGYPFNSTWPTVGNLTELAQTDYFTELFAKPFTTFVLWAFESIQYPAEVWADGMTTGEKASTKNEFYVFTKYLMNTYQGTNKTFILQNWEGDNAIGVPNATKTQGMIDWLNARQDGIDQAKAELSSITGVNVYGAAEVNLVTEARTNTGNGGPAVDLVIPNTHMDLYSYSAYDVGFPVNTTTLTDNLDYLKSVAPDSAAFGANNIFIGEYGIPENNFSAAMQKSHTQAITETALAWGAKYVIYWQLFCNEPTTSYVGRPTNSDLRGFWVMRPDGTKPPVYDYFMHLFGKNAVMQLNVNNDASATANRYRYSKFSDKAVTFRAGDVIEYDVKLLNNINGLGGIDIVNTDATAFRDSGWADQNAVGGHPVANLSAYANNVWFHRTLAVPAGMTGKTSSYWTLAGENDTASLAYAAQYDNVQITNNIFAASGDYTASGTAYSAGASAAVTTPSNTLQLAATNDATAVANRYSYNKFSNKAYTFRAGDYIEYDVKLLNNVTGAGGIDIANTDGSVFRDTGWSDQNGVTGHPIGNLTAYANNVWFHRKLAVPSSMVGKTASYWMIAAENDTASAAYTAQYDNIRITHTIFADSADYNNVGTALSAGNSSGAVTTRSQ